MIITMVMKQSLPLSFVCLVFSTEGRILKGILTMQWIFNDSHLNVTQGTLTLFSNTTQLASSFVQCTPPPPPPKHTLVTSLLLILFSYNAPSLTLQPRGFLHMLFSLPGVLSPRASMRLTSLLPLTYTSILIHSSEKRLFSPLPFCLLPFPLTYFPALP